MSLPVPHFQQEQSYNCLPACARMILAFHKHAHGEDELGRAFKTIPLIGTQPENVVAGLEALGYHALWFENATLERLLNLLAHRWPVIVFVRAQDLPYGRAGLHAVVIVDIDTKIVTCLDPTRNKPTHFVLSEFLKIWSNLGNQGLVIWV